MNNDDHRERLNVYWTWYSSLTRNQRHEHYEHKLRNKPKKQHYNEAVKKLPGVIKELDNRDDG